MTPWHVNPCPNKVMRDETLSLFKMYQQVIKGTFRSAPQLMTHKVGIQFHGIFDSGWYISLVDGL